MIPLLGLIPAAISTLGKLGQSWMERKKIKAEGKIKIEQARVEGRIKKEQTVATANAEWDNIVAEGMKTSWKDEYWTIILSIPAIMSFIPGLASYVKDGFSALEQTPQWYQIVLLLAVAASFGYRKIVDFIMRKNNGKGTSSS